MMITMVRYVPMGSLIRMTQCYLDGNTSQLAGLKVYVILNGGRLNSYLLSPCHHFLSDYCNLWPSDILTYINDVIN